MRLALFEDAEAAKFGPIVALRPVFELVCGRFSLRERLLRRQNTIAWGAIVRAELVESYAAMFPEAAVNNQRWFAAGPTLLVNGRWLPASSELQGIQDDTVGFCGDEIAYITLQAEEADLLGSLDLDRLLAQLANRRRSVAVGTMLRRPWDLIEHNSRQLTEDFQAVASPVAPASLPGVWVLGEASQLEIHPSATIEPGVVIDVRGGPVSIGPRAEIQAFSRIAGPTHLGAGSRALRAQIRGGTTIGPECRVGGEVESAILHGYVNKYHDGFLGHSYVCPWVNIGAGTTTSDLKIDYSTVRVPIGFENVDSGLIKVGSYFADHAKTGLSCQFNSGSTIGVLAQVLGSGSLLPKLIPSFSRVRSGQVEAGLTLDRCLSIVKAGMARRGVELTASEERLLRHVHAAEEQTRRLQVAQEWPTSVRT
jgi:UDP-N-acetylglucosamine diphosphorylase/glucosamine-1-phosphate N-acetyltransferase